MSIRRTDETFAAAARVLSSAALLELASLSAAFLDRPCQYETHRGSEWVNDGGRLVCGVCHPPARAAA